MTMANNRLALFLATVCGVGYFPWAPGTVASLVALGVGYAATVSNGFSPIWLALAAVILLIPAVLVSEIAEKRYAQSDPNSVVIDEVIGQWLAVSVAAGDNQVHWVLAFILFRVFDIAKPYPIRKCEHFPRGWGVVADDVAAGLCAMMILASVRWLLN